MSPGQMLCRARSRVQCRASRSWSVWTCDDLRLVGLKLNFLTVSSAMSLLRLSRREDWWKDAEILMLRNQLAVALRERPQTRPDGSAQRISASGAGGSRHRYPDAHCRCPAHPWQAIGVLGASAPATYPPCECRLPAGCTERDGIGIGDSGRAPGSRVEGLDHWSS
jgi:hypothetical protein